MIDENQEASSSPKIDRRKVTWMLIAAALMGAIAGPYITRAVGPLFEISPTAVSNQPGAADGNQAGKLVELGRFSNPAANLSAEHRALLESLLPDFALENCEKKTGYRNR